MEAEVRTNGLVTGGGAGGDSLGDRDLDLAPGICGGLSKQVLLRNTKYVYEIIIYALHKR